MTLGQNYETVSLTKVLDWFCESRIKSKKYKNKLYNAQQQYEMRNVKIL